MRESSSEFFDLGGPVPLDVLTFPPYPRTTVKAMGEAIRWRMDPATRAANHFRNVVERARLAVARLHELPADRVSFPESLDSETLGVSSRARVLHPPRISNRLQRILERLGREGARVESIRSDEGDSDGRTLAAIVSSRKGAWLACDWVRPGDGVARDLGLVAAECPDLSLLIEGSGASGRLPFPVRLAEEQKTVFVARSGGGFLSPPGVSIQIASRPPVAGAESDEVPDIALAALVASTTLLWEFGLADIASKIAEFQAALLPRLAEIGLTPVGVFEPSAPRPTILLRRLDGGPVAPIAEILRSAGVAVGLDADHLRLAFHLHNERGHVETFLSLLRAAHTPS